MHPNYSIRLAGPDDVPLLPGIELQAATLFQEVEWERDLPLDDVLPVATLHEAQQAGRLWVAVDETDDQPVGFALASVVDGRGHLDEIDVHPDHGRRGIGRALIAQVCTWARESGFSAITLTTERDIPWNAPFYARLGFTILDPAEWSDGLRQIIDHEADKGLNPDTRVVMIMAL